MDQQRDQREGVVTFEREKAPTDEQSRLRRDEARPKKEEWVGRGVIAWILIFIIIVPVFSTAISGIAFTGPGLLLWLVCFGLIALVVKWAGWA